MKYPIIFQGVKTRLKLSIQHSDDKKWYLHFLNKDGTTERNCISSFEKKEHSERCILAHNKRVGYTEDQVSKFIKKYFTDAEKKGKIKHKKAKGKKKKGAKKTKETQKRKQHKGDSKKRSGETRLKKNFFSNR